MLLLTIFLFGIWIILKDKTNLSKMLGPISLISLLFYIGQNLLGGESISNSIGYTSISLLYLSIGCFLLLALQIYKKTQLIFLIILLFSANILFKKNISPNNFSHAPEMDSKAELLIEINKDKLSELETLVKDYQLTIKPTFFPAEKDITNLDDYYTLDIPISHMHEIDKIKEKLKNNPHLKWVEPNEQIVFEFPTKSTTPKNENIQMTNDPSIGLQWHLGFLDMDKYYQLFKIRRLKPTKKAKLFILDTGIAPTHEDLPGKHANFNDTQGHGTHCAGIAGAITNNSIGIASIAPDPSWFDIEAIQVIGNVGFGTQQQIIAGIIKATDQGADVISMSLGGITNQEREKAYNDAVRYANSKGAIVVVAAGNANLDGKRYSPANAQNVISVASIQKNLQKSGFSNHVQNLEMGVCAPGENIWSTTPSNSYAALSGTSMATPQVAGLIAIMKSIRPTLTTREVFNILNNSGKSTADPQRTGKLIQPYQVITELIGN